MDYSSYFTNQPTEHIAKDLIGRMLTFNNNGQTLGGYIVETEAYLGKNDRAAHSYGGRRSPANEGLYCPGGSLYIYSQRQYFFFDIACQAQDVPEGVLIRAIEPVLGIEEMEANRHGKSGVLLTNGPGKMMQALGITSREWDLHPLAESPFTIDLDNVNKKVAGKIIAAPRVGINQSDSKWANAPLRFYPAGNPYVSDMKKANYQENYGWA